MAIGKNGAAVSWGGRIPAAVLRDPRLTPSAKAIYCYICGRAADTGGVELGHLDIASDVGLSAHSFYTHFRGLYRLGYVGMKKYGVCRRNLYEPVVVPDGALFLPADTEGLPEQDLAFYRRVACQGVYCLGTCTVPESLMLDDRLKPQEKALYCYLAAVTDNGEMESPSRAQIVHDMCLSPATIQGYKRRLTGLGWITARQVYSNGRFRGCTYGFPEQ